MHKLKGTVWKSLKELKAGDIFALDTIFITSYRAFVFNSDEMLPSTNLPVTPPGEDTIALQLKRHNYFNEPGTKCPVVAVIGVGYVGVHLVTAFSRHYRVIALDLSPRRRKELIEQFADSNVEVTGNSSRISEATHILISVPTILHHDSTIDTRHIQSALTTVSRYAQDGATVVIESSVAVGMTRKLLSPLIEARRLYGGMSPERVDPGRKLPHFEAIPKIVSGLDDIALKSIHELYSAVFEEVIPVSSTEVAEMTKLYENCQRMINIAYVNEMADACRPLGIDPLEVCSAASSKPFGYQPYMPGLGVGGHCIPVNPHYLLSTSEFPLLKAAARTMSQRPAQQAERIVKRLRDSGVCRQPRVLVVGVGFKRGQSVLSNSPGVQLIVSLLHEHECYVEFCDPLVPQEDLEFVPKYDHAKSWTRAEIESQFDAVAVVVDQLHLDLSILPLMQGTILENYTTALPWLSHRAETSPCSESRPRSAGRYRQSEIGVLA